MPDALDGDFSRSRAVLVGAWDYRELTAIPAAEHSLYRMRDLLTSPLCGPWPEERVKVIGNPRTPSGVLDDLVTWFREATDVALFYFVGHGQYDAAGELCLALRDTRTDPLRRGFTSLGFHHIRDAFHASRAATKIGVLDCCNAGLAVAANTLGPAGAGSVAQERRPLEPPPARGFYLMMASSELTAARFQSATEAPRPQTYFTKYLADTVEHGIPGHPPALGLGPIFDRVAQAMRRDGLPEPHHSSGDHAGHFVFARNAATPGTADAHVETTTTTPAETTSATSTDSAIPAAPRLYRRRAVLATAAASVAAVCTGVWFLADQHSGGPPTQSGSAPSTGQFASTSTLTATRTITTATPLGAPIAVGATVYSVAFDATGHVLACGTDDNDVDLWNTSDPAHPARLAQPLTGPANSVLAVTFSPDGKTLVGGSYDATIRCWDVSVPAQPKALGQPLTASTIKGVTSVAFATDGRTLATAGNDHLVRLWNVSDPAHPVQLGTPLVGHTDRVASVTFSPDGRTLATASNDDTVRLWNVTDPAHAGPLGQPLTAHNAVVNCVAFRRDGHVLASCGDDKMIRLWDVSEPAHPEPLGQPLAGHTKSVETVAFHPSGNTLASGGNDTTVRLWNLSQPARATPIGEPLRGHGGTVNSVAFSPDATTLASGSSDSTIRFWKLN